MAKKYSFQMEDDRVISVEVDGVSYPSPEDIPNPQDRQKLRTMIARAAEAGSEEETDEAFERQFQSDLRELEKQSATLPRLLGGIFLAIAVIALAVCAYSAYGAWQTARREVSAPGRVVDLVERSSRDSKTGAVTVFSYPVVEFTASNGQAQKVQTSEGSYPPAYSAGDAVTVLYDPQQPREARIKSFSSDLMLWLLPIITGVVGTAFGGVALAVLKMAFGRKPAIPQP